MTRKARPLPEGFEEMVKETYDGSTEVINQIQACFPDIPRWMITRKGNEFGLKAFSRSFWTKKEIQWLEDNYHLGLSYCAKKLKRTEVAVQLKAKRLNLGGFILGTHFFTAQNVSNLMGVDIHAVLRWLERGWLKHRLANANRKFYFISKSELVEFMENYIDEWDSRKIKQSLWVNEPLWYREKKLRDSQRPKREAQKWTREEDKQLISLFKSGAYKQKEIARIMNRSVSGVAHRLKRLDVWGTGLYVGD